MSQLLFKLLATLAVVMAASCAFATDQGKALLYGGAGQGRVIFDGRVHAAKGYVCNDCHNTLFATKKEARITMEDHTSDRKCFACHNGEKAFNDCGQCHRKFEDAPSVGHLVAASATPQAAKPAAAHEVFTYEGATTIGTGIMPKAAHLFAAKTGVTFSAIGGAGAKAGLGAARDGKVTFGGVARAVTAEERAQLTAAVTIGYDVMGVFVNQSNPVKALTRAQLKEIFTGRVTNWKQVGGADQPIVIYSEKLTGGRATVEAFRTMVLGTEQYGKVHELDDATDCIAEVQKDANGITASSMSFAKSGVVPIAVDGGEPTRAGVQAGKYPLTRPLVLVTKQPVEGNVKAFLDFMLTPEAQQIVGEKFVPVR